MNRKNHRWWRIGGVTVALGGSAAVYFLIRRKKSKRFLFETRQSGTFQSGTRQSGTFQSGTNVGQTQQRTSVAESGKKGTTRAEPDWNHPFDMNYEQDVRRWVAPQVLRVLPEQTARETARRLYEAKGATWWKNDEEAAVATVFGKQLRDKVQVARLSRAFWQVYQKDLWEYLRGFLSASEMERYVHRPVRRLPNYRLA